MTAQNNTAILILFLTFLSLALAALLIAWFQGRQWGDLSSRKHYGEALTEDEQKALRRSRRSFWIWAGVSAFFLALSFFALRT